MKWIAFDRHCRLIPDQILNLIIDQAKRGKVTDAAKNLLLIPDTRKGNRPDASGMWELGRVRKKDCFTLAQFSRKWRKIGSETAKSEKTRI